MLHKQPIYIHLYSFQWYIIENGEIVDDLPLLYITFMWVCHDAINAPSLSHHHVQKGGRHQPFPVMGGLWHCFTMFYPQVI